eukprot:1150139-Pelagomonas_calceolata.AAC.3
MRIGQVVSCAPRRPDSPSYGIRLRAPSNPPSEAPRGIFEGSRWARPGIERAKRASGRLWWWAEEPVPLGKIQSGIAIRSKKCVNK